MQAFASAVGANLRRLLSLERPLSRPAPVVDRARARIPPCSCGRAAARPCAAAVGQGLRAVAHGFCGVARGAQRGQPRPGAHAPAHGRQRAVHDPCGARPTGAAAGTGWCARRGHRQGSGAQALGAAAPAQLGSRYGAEAESGEGGQGEGKSGTERLPRTRRPRHGDTPAPPASYAQVSRTRR